MKLSLGKDDFFMVFLNLIVIGFGIYYCRTMIKEDYSGFYWIILIVVGAVLILSDIFIIVYSVKITYIVFIVFIALLVRNAYILNEADNKEMDSVYFEIATRGPPFSEFLEPEQSIKGPKFGSHNSWVYKRVKENEFSIYRLEKLNLMRRDYPDTKGWYAVLSNDIVLKILLMRHLSESEKEAEVSRVLTEMGLNDFPAY